MNTIKNRQTPLPKPTPGSARIRPVTEKVYESFFARALDRLGYFTYHTNERFYLGIPDRYIAGGNWCEFKQIKWMGTRPVTPMAQFKPKQIDTLDRLTMAGDKTWVAILFQTPDGQMRSYFRPWPVFRHLKKQWSVVDVTARTQHWERNTEHTILLIQQASFHATRRIPEA